MDCLTIDPVDNPDYCTIQRTVKPWRYLAVVMRWDVTTDSYVIQQAMGPMTKPEAERMARGWAKTGGVEYRP